MKIHIFGCLSGTEPMQNKHHTSWALEINNIFYMFDAGDNCAHTAFLKGLDLTKIKALFISHPHRDHIDGLYHLTGVICKILELDPTRPPVTLPVYTSEKRLVPAINTLIDINGNHPYFTLLHKDFSKAGIIFSDENIEITVIGTNHMEKDADGVFRSWSFRIKAEGKNIIYSGDVKSPDELDIFLKEGCDYVLMESGHHNPPEVCKKWKEADYKIGNLLFLHHGRHFLRDEEKCFALCKEVWGNTVSFAFDGMTVEI